MSLQVDDKAAFEEMPVFGLWLQAYHDSSLYLFVLVLFIEAEVLPQVYLTINIFYYLACYLDK